MPKTPSYESYSGVRLEGNETIVGDGWIAENGDGLLSAHVHMVDGGVDAVPASRESGRKANVAEGLVATLHVPESKISICAPDDETWRQEMPEDRVLLDNEALRVKIEITPQIKSLAQCRQMCGDALIVKTSGTCPTGVTVPLGDDVSLINSQGMSEIRIVKTRQQLVALGLLPQKDDDEIDEMASYDIGDADIKHDSNLTDSAEFLSLPMELRGVSNNDLTKSLDSTPPTSRPTLSFFKAAGCETVSVSFMGVSSARRLIMNQADYLYVSGHGHHINGQVEGIGPEQVRDWWNRDLDCVVFSACSILDIGNYNDNVYPGDTTPSRASPGKLWEQTGPSVLLGYNALAPGDKGGAPAKIIKGWVSVRGEQGNIGAWMRVNNYYLATNACAIEKGKAYYYIKRLAKGLLSYTQVVKKEEWK